MTTLDLELKTWRENLRGENKGCHFHDHTISRRRKRSREENYGEKHGYRRFSDILYADDTFLVGKHSRELNKILWAIENTQADTACGLIKENASTSIWTTET